MKKYLEIAFIIGVLALILYLAFTKGCKEAARPNPIEEIYKISAGTKAAVDTLSAELSEAHLLIQLYVSEQKALMDENARLLNSLRHSSRKSKSAIDSLEQRINNLNKERSRLMEDARKFE